jgi:hypothetical protein
MFHYQRKFNDAHTHIERAKLHAVNDVYFMGRVMRLQAEFWWDEHRIYEARSGALYALRVFEGLGAVEQGVVYSIYHRTSYSYLTLVRRGEGVGRA